jgi:heavy metal sensor kinase
MPGFLRSTRGRLVLFQVGILAVASALGALAIFELVTIPQTSKLTQMLYDQWGAIAGGVDLSADGKVFYGPGQLPETSADQQVPIEANVYGPDGLVRQTQKQSLSGDFVAGVARQVLKTGQPFGPYDVVDASGDGRRLYVASEPLGPSRGHPAAAIAVSVSTADLDALTRRLLATLGLVGALVVALGAMLAWLVVGRTLAPVRAIAEAARTISERDLGQRVNVPAPADELGRLKATFNDMLARLELSFDSLRRFTADASHELRSPLTLMRTEVEVTLASPREREEYERVLRSVRNEVEHLSRVVDQMLLLAQADAGTLNPLRTEVDVADFVEEEAARWRGVSTARQVGIEVEAPASGTVTADPDLLRRVLDNLLDNALRHSPTGGRVMLRASRDNGDWTFEVADQGPGVPVGIRDRVFERFARADLVRTRRDGGAGLGLALSAAVAQAHGGSLELVEGNGSGAVFRLRLPSTAPMA